MFAKSASQRPIPSAGITVQLRASWRARGSAQSCGKSRNPGPDRGGAHVERAIMPVTQRRRSDAHQSGEARDSASPGPFPRWFDGRRTRSSPRAGPRNVAQISAGANNHRESTRRNCLRATGSDCSVCDGNDGSCGWLLLCGGCTSTLWLLPLAPRLPSRSPLPAISTPEASFCRCCNVRQTHSVRRLLAACGLRSVPTMSLR